MSDGTPARGTYVDIPVDAAAFDEKRDGKRGNNVIDALNRQIKVLADKSQPKEKRAEALKWVVHLVGDIEQPLHCADRDDRGGNARKVYYPGQNRETNLHSVWDTWLVRDIVGRRPVARAADAMGRTITAAQREKWARGTPEQWANESHGVAVKVAYDGVPADGPAPRLDARYVEAAKAAAAERIKRGGVRLAAVLNRALR